MQDFASFDEILNNMVSLMKDDAWKRVRSLITPTFSTGKLKLVGVQTWSPIEC